MTYATPSVSSHAFSDQVVVSNGVSLPITQYHFFFFLAFFFRLYDVLHVPSLCKNLMSIAQLTHDLLVSIIFYPWGYVICDLHSSKILFQGQCKDGLYHVLPYSSPSHGSKQALISIPHPPSGIIISDIPLIVFLEI